MSAPAVAQDRGGVRGEGPGDARAESFRPTGVPVGAFTLLPKVDLRATHNSNIYTQKNNPQRDWIYTVAPSFALNSNWRTHALGFNAGVSHQHYQRNANDRRTAWNVGGNGRLDIAQDTSVSARTSYRLNFDDRGSPDTPTGASEPTRSYVFNGRLEGNHRINRVSFRAVGSAENFDFKNTRLATGASRNNDARDRTDWRGSLQVGYTIQEGYEAFVRGEHLRRDFRLSVDPTQANNLQRDARQWRVVGGTQFLLTDVLTGSVNAGWMQHNFDRAEYENISSWTAGGNLRWAVDRLTAITATVDRRVDPTTEQRYSGIIATSGSLRLTHDLNRQIRLGANAGVTRNEFKLRSNTTDPNGQKRETIYDVGFSGLYRVNRYVHLTSGYEFQRKTVNHANQGHDVHKVTVGSTLQF